MDAQKPENTEAEELIVENEAAEAENNENNAAPEKETAAAENPADADWKDRYMRLAADFDNFKKRTNKEKEMSHRYAGEELLKAFLPVLDDLERALKAAETAQDVEAIKNGLAMVVKKMGHGLERQGVKPIPAKGEIFNSEFHEAIAQAPAPDGEQKGKVLEEIEKGYFYHDKIIRFAKVIIGE